MKRLKEIHNQSMHGVHDVEALAVSSGTGVGDVSLEKHSSHGGDTYDLIQATIPPVQLSLRDVNPVKPLGLVLRRQNNIIILFGSGKPPGTKARSKMIYAFDQVFYSDSGI